MNYRGITVSVAVVSQLVLLACVVIITASLAN